MSSGENPYDYTDNPEDQFASEYDFGLTTAGGEDEDISNPEKQPIIDEDNILNSTIDTKNEIGVDQITSKSSDETSNVNSAGHSEGFLSP